MPILNRGHEQVVDLGNEVLACSLESCPPTCRPAAGAAAEAAEPKTALSWMLATPRNRRGHEFGRFSHTRMPHHALQKPLRRAMRLTGPVVAFGCALRYVPGMENRRP